LEVLNKKPIFEAAAGVIPVAALLVFRQVKWNYLVGFALMILAVFFVFKKGFK